MSGRLPSVTSPATVRRRPCPAPRTLVTSIPSSAAAAGAAGCSRPDQTGGGSRNGYLAVAAPGRHEAVGTTKFYVDVHLTTNGCPSQGATPSRCQSRSPVNCTRAGSAHCRSQSQLSCQRASPADGHHSHSGCLHHHQHNSSHRRADGSDQGQVASQLCPCRRPGRRDIDTMRHVAAPQAASDTRKPDQPQQTPPDPSPRPPLDPPQKTPSCQQRQTPSCFPRASQRQTPPVPQQRTPPGASLRPPPGPPRQTSAGDLLRPPSGPPRQSSAGELHSVKLSAACRRFNANAALAVDAMIEQGLLPKSPEEVARFLRRRDDLQKRAVGDYLGEPGEFAQAVLAAFIARFDFSELSLLAALRILLDAFLLHGESQKVYRIIDCFAQHYHRQNPDRFRNADGCSVLSFAIVILNTTMHNPQVRVKPPPEEFVAMVRGSGQVAVTRDELLQLYRQLRDEPLRTPNDDSATELRRALSQPEHHGWLLKQGGRIKTWKNRWFILKHNCLHYFEDRNDKNAKGVVVLENVTLRTVPEQEKFNCFELVQLQGEEASATVAPYLKACKRSRCLLGGGDTVSGRHRVFRMSATSQKEMAEWMRAIQRSIVLRPMQTVRRSLMPAAASGGRCRRSPPSR